MSEETLEQDSIIELVNEVTDKKTFNIFNAITNRSYPHASVTVFLNEELAFKASILQDEIRELQPRAVAIKEDAEKLVTVEAELEEIIKLLDDDKYIFHIYGISEGEREKLLDMTVKKYPVEFSEEKNPFTGETNKTEIDNVERDRFFTFLLWKSQIRKIESPDGSVQESFNDEEIEALRTQLPISAIAEINQTIDKVRASTAVFMAKVNQDFLAKR